MDIYQVRAESEAAQHRVLTLGTASPHTGLVSPTQQSTAVNADGTVVALPGSYQAPLGTWLLVVPVQPPEAEAQQQQSTHSMQPLTDHKNKEEAARTVSGATDAESGAGTRV
ncbi:hypothetical protein MRX96_028801 [Rhipicephalus microplus]